MSTSSTSGEQLDAELEAIRGRLSTVEQKVADIEAIQQAGGSQISEISVSMIMPDSTTKTVTFVPAPETETETTTTTSEAEDTGSSS